MYCATGTYSPNVPRSRALGGVLVNTKERAPRKTVLVNALRLPPKHMVIGRMIGWHYYQSSSTVDKADRRLVCQDTPNTIRKEKYIQGWVPLPICLPNTPTLPQASDPTNAKAISEQRIKTYSHLITAKFEYQSLKRLDLRYIEIDDQCKG